MLTFDSDVAQDFRARYGRWIEINLDGFSPPNGRPTPGERAILRNFSKEWNDYAWTEESYWDMSPEQALACKRFELGLSRHSIKHKLVLEVGTGIGGTADMLSRSEACEIIGVDLSYSVDRAQALFGSNELFHVVQASAFALPFRRGSFDYVFSHGVLHHTYDTRVAFDAVAAYPKEGGMLYVWLYSKAQEQATSLRRMLMLIESIVRRPLSQMPSRLQTLCLAPTLPAYVLYQNLYRRARLGTGSATYGWNQALHAARDRLTPPYAHRHSYEEVAGWFKDNGYAELEMLRDESLPNGISESYALNVGIRGRWNRPAKLGATA